MVDPKVRVIADLCSNAWPYDLRLSAFLDAVRDAGAWAAKIQVFSPDDFSEEERKEKGRVRFPYGFLGRFVDECKARGLVAMASVFNAEATRLCADAGMDYLKLASREWGKSQVRNAVSDTELPFIASVPFGEELPPNWGISFRKGEERLWCIPEYPTEDWSAIDRVTFGPGWGWSSHTAPSDCWADVLQAVEAGATIIEKHLALSPNDPEAAWSLLPQELKEMCDAIRA